MDLTALAEDYWKAKDDRVDQERLALLVDRVPVGGGEVLVVDGGPGMLAEALRVRGHAVRMTDLSRHAVERARAKGLVADAVDTDDGPLPFADGRFACVVSDSAIEHRYFPERAVAECARVLAPGGTFVLLVPNVAHWRQRLWLLLGRFPEIKDGPTDRSHLRFFAMPEAKRLLAGAGLELREVAGSPCLWVKGLYPRLLRAPGVRALYRALVRVRPSLFARDLILVGRKPG